MYYIFNLSSSHALTHCEYTEILDYIRIAAHFRILPVVAFWSTSGDVFLKYDLSSKQLYFTFKFYIISMSSKSWMSKSAIRSDNL